MSKIVQDEGRHERAEERRKRRAHRTLMRSAIEEATKKERQSATVGEIPPRRYCSH